jgi:hypothetical protein
LNVCGCMYGERGTERVCLEMTCRFGGFQLERISLICSLHLSLNSLSLAIIGFLFWSWYCFGQCMTNSLPRQKDYGHFTTIVGSKS